MTNSNTLTWLIAITLALSVINLYMTMSIQGQIDDIESAPAAPSAPAPSPAPTAAAAAKPNLPPPVVDVSVDDDAIKGDKNAPVTIVEFSDYECPFCARYVANTFPQINEKYIKTGKVKYVMRDFPLGFHQHAQKAAEAAECAGEQGKYWDMHDKLFGEGVSGGVASYKKYASEIGLDQTKFDKCLDNGEMAEEVKADMAQGSQYGVSGTPGFFINGVKISGAQPFANFEAVIEAELNK